MSVKAAQNMSQVRTPMIKKSYTVRFLTPAFLGNADQSGQWRTPPLKALIRQWWRVAAAKEFKYDYRRLREVEGRLFGHAWLDSDKDSRGNSVSGRKSAVRLRLNRWNEGSMYSWESDLAVKHPEVGVAGKNVGSNLYLGYGPLSYDRNTKNTALKANAAIQVDEYAVLRLAFPSDQLRGINDALALIHFYGTLGGRSRNGWGSLELLDEDDAPISGDSLVHGFLHEWSQALQRDWPCTIGSDERGALIWHTKNFGHWKKLMQELAKIKIGLRTQFAFHTGRNASHPEDRHWLSYPVTNHSVNEWKNKRLPNSLRFKVRRNGAGKLYGVIFHMPCRPPQEFNPNAGVLRKVWLRVHGFLDDHKALERSPI